ncbi:hypothetical protein JL100_034405 (plasmid) [Skermanella mucosa]|uniref:hypothetical protein n=1 Tax=Skermanella mucosa TaxID=1789672 RepID=UPI00192AB8D8|nr:hypothetical protein [Skermanella mucosa]UEM24834.1 hypothetical protein JL100_034405 [Skermanella mucosa]
MLSFEAFQVILLVVLSGLIAVPLTACWKLCRRTGRSGWFSLLLLVPVLNVVAVYWFVLSRPRKPSTCSKEAAGSRAALPEPAGRRHRAGAV